MKKDAEFSEVKLLRVDGGASHNNLLMQMQANALQASFMSLNFAVNLCQVRW